MNQFVGFAIAGIWNFQRKINRFLNMVQVGSQKYSSLFFLMKFSDILKPNLAKCSYGWLSLWPHYQIEWMLDEQSWMNRLQRSVSAFLWTVNMGLDQCFLFHFFHIKKLEKYNTNKLGKLVEFFGTRKIEISKNFPSSLSQKSQIFSRKTKKHWAEPVTGRLHTKIEMLTTQFGWWGIYMGSSMTWLLNGCMEILI